MKKKILFVIPSLRSGGAEKSLITLLSLFDYEKYDVDLLLFRKDGLFFEKLPKSVNIIGNTDNYEIFDGEAKNAILYFIKKFKFVSAVERYKYSKAFSENDEYKRETLLWKYLRKQLPEIQKKYDISVGYLEGNASRFAVENVNADKKIVYVHNDIKKLNVNKKYFEEIFDKADKIVTVSNECLESLTDEFLKYTKKFVIIENITSPELLKKEAELEADVFMKKNGEKILLTIGRCFPQKNIPLAIKTCAYLKSQKKNIKWYHIGDGPLKKEDEKLIRELHLENDFIMLGEKSNPYPYISQCDIYVQTSEFEGKSIAIDEAKCLYKPIVVTDFSTVFDQIVDNVTGMIAQMNVRSLSEKIEYLIDSPEKCKQLSENLIKSNPGNEIEIEKFYDIIE